MTFRLFKWFEDSHLKTIPGMSHILLCNEKTEKVTIDNVVLSSSVKDTFFGFSLDSELKFEKHLTGICNKANQKIYVLSRITS